MDKLKKFTFYYKNHLDFGVIGPYNSRERGTRKIYVYAGSSYRASQTFYDQRHKIKDHKGRLALTIYDLQGVMDLSKPPLTSAELKGRLVGRRYA